MALPVSSQSMNAKRLSLPAWKYNECFDKGFSAGWLVKVGTVEH